MTRRGSRRHPSVADRVADRVVQPLQIAPVTAPLRRPPPPPGLYHFADGPPEEFRDDCARCGEGWGSGDRYAAREYLRAQGFDLPVSRV